MSRELQLLSELNLRSVQPPKAIWQTGPVVIEALHREQFEAVVRRRRQLKDGRAARNIVLEGRAGVGKSHFLSRVRRDAIEAGDLFVAVHLTKATEFFEALALSYAESLLKPHSEGVTQLQALLDALLQRCGVDDDDALAMVSGVIDEQILAKAQRGFARALGRTPDARAATDVALALLLLNSDDSGHTDIAYSVLEGIELDDEQARFSAIKARSIHPRELIRAVDTLAHKAGKVVVAALDQLDGLIAVAEKAVAEGDRSELNVVANDLMTFAEVSEHTLIVLSCIRASWELIRDKAIQATQYRFPEILHLGEIPSDACGRELIGELLGLEYRRLGLTPAYPTWPIRPEAFADAPDYTSRGLILAVERHIGECVRSGRLVELARLGSGEATPPAPPAVPEPAPTSEADFAALDVRFAELRAAAAVPGYFDEAIEVSLPPLLASALAAFAGENAGIAHFRLDEPQDVKTGAKQSLSARIRQVLDAEREDEVHWSFRFIPHAHGKAQLSRLQAARTASALGRQRNLTIVRNGPWSTGAKTREALAELDRLGGRVVPLKDDDVRTFAALHAMIDAMPPGFDAWLRARRPASGTTLLRAIRVEGAPNGPGDGGGTSAPAAIPPVATGPAAASSNPSAARTAPPPTPNRAEAPRVPAGHILVGRTPNSGRDVTIPLEELRRHAAVFAGSGSGKTVLLRRLVEECALAGVSAIVLDPNNDLARLGTRQPEPHPGWLAGDAEKAARYHAEVDVAIWTPRMSSGRPLSFAPLAGLAAVAGDRDDFEVALDCAVDLLAPRARLPLSTAKGQQGRAVLKEAVRAYVRGGQTTIAGFIRFLSELPEGVVPLDNADKFAVEIARTLTAETINDPMFGDAGEAVDPDVLFAPPAGKRARVSVISFVGLPNLDQQQQFVSQLGLAVFAWAKRNPAGDRPLGGLFVIDEAQNFAPSGAMTPSTAAMLALASQARKYGLGLMFATQAPKGLHNRIAGNCATQMFGFLNASAQIAAAQEIAAARGGRVDDIAKLRPGAFYVGIEGLAFQRVDTPFCLSHHPRSPLGREEILQLAAA